MMAVSDGAARLEVLLLGTGTSSQVPSIACLTDPDQMGCKCCTSKDKKNYRRNTSAVVRIHHDHPSARPSSVESDHRLEDPLDDRSRGPAEHHPQRPRGITQYLLDHHINTTTYDAHHHPPPAALNRSSTPKTSHILIDVGKSFCEAARDHFPRNQIRNLDAVLLTHPHADAINGLDDLRAWTLGGAIQHSVPIYCDQYTYSEISKMYPYLTNSSAKTGGGDVPEFTWNIIEDGKSFQICGVEITPLVVYHGKFFNGDSSPDQARPFKCLSFLIDRSIYYVSDVSEIPETTLDLLKIKLEHNADRHHKSLSVHGHQIAPNHPQRGVQSSHAANRLQVLIVDTLRLDSHTSHFGIAQSVDTIRMLNPVKSYLIGFTHGVSHACWVHCCEAISEGKQSIDFVKRAISSPSPALDPSHRSMEPKQQAERSTIEREKLLHRGIIEDFDWFTYRALRSIEVEGPKNVKRSPRCLSYDPARDAHLHRSPRDLHLSRPWVRPSFDGLLIRIDRSTRRVWDGFYDLE